MLARPRSRCSTRLTVLLRWRPCSIVANVSLGPASSSSCSKRAAGVSRAELTCTGRDSDHSAVRSIPPSTVSRTPAYLHRLLSLTPIPSPQESELTPTGSNLLDGRFAVFGYVVDNATLLADLQVTLPLRSTLTVVLRKSAASLRAELHVGARSGCRSFPGRARSPVVHSHPHERIRSGASCLMTRGTETAVASVFLSRCVRDGCSADAAGYAFSRWVTKSTTSRCWTASRTSKLRRREEASAEDSMSTVLTRARRARTSRSS